MQSTPKQLPKVCISLQNSKLSPQILSVSLTPVASCLRDAPRDLPCAKDCYARKVIRYSKNSKIAYARNFYLAQHRPAAFFTQIVDWLTKKQASKRPARFFRIHASGDFFSQSYLDGWKTLAEMFPQIKFLAFTKRFDLDLTTSTPQNLTIILSAWPKSYSPEFSRLAACGHPIAWMQDGTENRIPFTAIECPGSCDNCAMCWNLPQLNVDVVFHKH